MSKAKKVWLIIGLVVLTLALVAVLAFCGLTKWLAGDPKEETLGGDMTYTVQVKNAADTPMEAIGVYIYEDETQQALKARCPLLTQPATNMWLYWMMFPRVMRQRITIL